MMARAASTAASKASSLMLRACQILASAVTSEPIRLMAQRAFTSSATASPSARRARSAAASRGSGCSGLCHAPTSAISTSCASNARRMSRSRSASSIDTGGQ